MIGPRNEKKKLANICADELSKGRGPKLLPAVVKMYAADYILTFRFLIYLIFH